MNKSPNLLEKTAKRPSLPIRQDQCDLLSLHEKEEIEESLKIWESTEKEFQSLTKKKKANWMENMSSLRVVPEATSQPSGGHIGHYGDFSFCDDEESSGGGYSDVESNEEVVESEPSKRKHLEGDTSDESSDEEIFIQTRTKKRKLMDKMTNDELLLPDSDSSQEVWYENQAEEQKEKSRLIKERDMAVRKQSQDDYLNLDDLDGKEEDIDIPEEFKVQPAKEYHSDVPSDNEQVQGSKTALADTIEKEKLIVILRWITGKRKVEKKIMVLSETKFKNIKHMVARNFKVKLKMMFDGEVIKDSDNAKSLGLEITLDNENADLIDCIVLEDLCKS